ncbi:hypothetical protein V8C86DRAFT_2977667 [Haematococcus lacustris]
MPLQLCQNHLCLVGRASPAPAIRPKQKRFRQTACMPRASTSGCPDASTAELTKYMSDLSEDEQADVLSKFVAAGFVGAKQKKVSRLSNQELECIGIQPQGVRSTLLQAFVDGGPGKTILLVDSEGTEEQLSFRRKQDFDRWLHHNTLVELLPNGVKQVVAAWEDLEDGGRYFTNKTFDKRVADVEGYQSTQSRSLEDEVAERALADMLQQYPEAVRLCVSELKNEHGQYRQYDGIIVADDCVQVVEVKSKLDIAAVMQLRSAIDFMRQAATAGAPDLAFARRADGSVKDIKGALGGLHVVAGDQRERALMQAISQGQYDMYLPNGKRFSSGSACHPTQAAPVHCE